MTFCDIDAKNIEILQSPTSFFEETIKLIDSSKSRLALAALYIGEGALEDKLMDAVIRAKQRGVSVYLLLDKNRSTRMGCRKYDTSYTHLYGHPLHENWIYGWFPERANEMIGVQHMKGIVSDDTVLITGANFSDSYFTDREDRWWVIRNEGILASQVYDLFKDPTGVGGESVGKTSPSSVNVSTDTSIQICRQAGYLYPHPITEIDEAMNEFIDSSTNILFASGYFNPTPDIVHKLARKPQSVLITAHPHATSFFNSKGFSGNIPTMYAILHNSLIQHLPESVKLWEWNKSGGWTFHSKGLWAIEKPTKRDTGDTEVITGTMIGSSNYGYRSRFKDLEMCFVVKTKNENLQNSMKSEVERIQKECKIVDTSELKSRVNAGGAILKAMTKFVFKHFL
jgi:CDP-diacylglycerol---glycerol-3-phosphate 3-phosphatidyltransferase